MKIALATVRIEEALQSWIDRVAYIPEHNNLEEWVSHAECLANNRQFENQEIVVEMRGIATATGRPETLTLDPKDFNFVTLKEEV